MGKIHFEYLEEKNVYICRTCQAHLTHIRELISKVTNFPKGFKGKGGKAYLFDKVINVKSGPKVQRELISGIHVVCDLYCKGCDTEEIAYEDSQKYKEGKFILEKAQIQKLFWQE